MPEVVSICGLADGLSGVVIARRVGESGPQRLSEFVIGVGASVEDRIGVVAWPPGCSGRWSACRRLTWLGRGRLQHRSPCMKGLASRPSWLLSESDGSATRRRPGAAAWSRRPGGRQCRGVYGQMREGRAAHDLGDRRLGRAVRRHLRRHGRAGWGSAPLFGNLPRDAGR